VIHIGRHNLIATLQVVGYGMRPELGASDKCEKERPAKLCQVEPASRDMLNTL